MFSFSTFWFSHTYPNPLICNICLTLEAQFVRPITGTTQMSYSKSVQLSLVIAFVALPD